MFYGNLDASQLIAGIAFALGLGLGDLKFEVVVPLILNLHGNAITLSNELKLAEIGKIFSTPPRFAVRAHEPTSFRR